MRGWYSLLGAILWGQVEGWIGGGPIGAHQIPIIRQGSRRGIAHRGGDKRWPGPGFTALITSRYVRTPIHFLGFFWGVQSFQVHPASRREEFQYAVAGVQSGWRVSPEKSCYIGGHIGGAFLLKAQSRPDSATVYRFQDYYSRAILRTGAFVEKRWQERWALMLYWQIDWSSAQDRGLFCSYWALVHHMTLAAIVSYRLWPGIRPSRTFSPS